MPKITELTPSGSVGGGELIPVSDDDSPKSITTENIKDYVVDQLEAISAGSSVSGSDGVYILQGGALKPVDIDTVAQHVIDAIWSKEAETEPDDTDVLPLKDGGVTEKTVTLSVLSDYITATIEAAILDLSDLEDGSGTLASSDYLLVTQESAGVRVQLSDVDNAIYQGLAAHVAAEAGVASGDDADVVYVVRDSTPYKMTLSQFASYIGASDISGSGTAGTLAQWADTTTLQASCSVVDSATGFPTGDDDTIPTTLAVRGELETFVDDQADIGGDLEDSDSLLVDDDDVVVGTKLRKSAVSRVWTYILAKLTAVTDVSSLGWVVDEDDMASDDATKVPTQQSVKAYVDSNAAALGDIDLVGATEVGGDLVDNDLLLVDSGASGTNRSALLYRFWTYIVGKLRDCTSKSTPVSGDLVWIQDSADSNSLKEASLADLVKGLPVMVGDSGAGGTQGVVPAPSAGDGAGDKYFKADGTWHTPGVAAGWDGDITDVSMIGGADIGADLADADLFIVDDGATGTIRKSAVSRIWTYVVGKVQGLSAKATAIDTDILTIQDSADSNGLKEFTFANLWVYVKAKIQAMTDLAVTTIDLDSATDIGGDLADSDLLLVDDGASGTNRKCELSRVKSYCEPADLVGDSGSGGTAGLAPAPAAGDAAAGKFLKADGAWMVPPSWDGDITDMDVAGGTDIGAGLADGDLLVVDDGAGGTIRKSAVSRLWTYVISKIQGLSAKSAPTDDDILLIQDAADSNNLKELTVANLKKTTINSQTGTSYTLVLADANKHVRLNNASAITMTVPPNSSVAFPIGSQISFIQVGAGQVTVAEGAGVTVNKSETLNLRAQFSAGTLVKVATDEWDLIGDLEVSA